MKKRLLAVLLTVAVALVMLPAAGAAATVNNLTYEIANGEVKITHCDINAAGELVIPDTIDGYPVTAIGDCAFNSCYGLTGVTIPDSVVDIGAGVFSGCFDLTDVALPESLTAIGAAAFQGCTSLTDVTLPEGLKTIGESAFQDCRSLTEIVIPDSTVYVGGSAFAACTGLKKAVVPAGAALGSGVFESCAALGDEQGFLIFHNILCEYFGSAADVVIPDGVTDIAGCAFHQCTGLQRVVIPEGVTDIGERAFALCVNLADITIPNSVKSIGDEAFSCCTALTDIAVPASAVLGSGAFNGCTGLADDRGFVIVNHVLFGIPDNTAEVVIPDSVVVVDAAFPGNMTSLTIPASVTGLRLVNSSFYLTSITVAENNPAYSVRDGILYSKDRTELVLYPTGRTDESYNIESGVTAIGPGAFAGCGWLNRLAFPASLKTVGDSAFFLCSNLNLIYYLGSEEAWSDIAIGAQNDCLLAAYVCCYPAAGRFTDLDPVGSSWYMDAVEWAVDGEITNGMTETTFEPNTTCNRAQIVTFLWRAAGCPEPTSTYNPFVDVSSTDYFYKAVLWAAEKGITDGMTETTFVPDGDCTRGQAVTFLWRAAGKPVSASAGNYFTDVKSADYFYQAVLWAGDRGVTYGMTATTFVPDGTCTRGQIVTFLYRWQTSGG